MIWTIGNVILIMILERLGPSSSDVDISRAFPLHLHCPVPVGHLSRRRPQISPLLADQAPSYTLALNRLPHLRTHNVLTSEMSPWHFKLKTVKNPTHYLSHLPFLWCNPSPLPVFLPHIVSVIMSGNLRTSINSA